MKKNSIMSLFSQRCCGGPVMVLAGVCAAIGTGFVLLSAVVPGGIFITAGIVAMVSCLAMGYRKCRSPESYPRKRGCRNPAGKGVRKPILRVYAGMIIQDARLLTRRVPG